MTVSAKALGLVQPAGFPELPENWELSSHTFEIRKKSFFSLQMKKKKLSKCPRVLMVLHGYGEHCGRYLHLPHFLNESIDWVVTYDHRGHGRSEGIRGHVDSFQEYVDDAAYLARVFREECLQSHEAVEFHLLAHSMGGLIGIELLSQFRDLGFHSAILSSPLLGLSAPVPAIKKLAGNLLSQVWGSIHLPTEVDPQSLSRDSAVVSTYQLDRLNHAKVTPRWFTEMKKTVKKAHSQSYQIDVPTLFLIPSDDRLVDSNATQKFFDRLVCSQKEKRDLDGFFHESLNDTGKEQVFHEIALWLKKNSSFQEN